MTELDFENDQKLKSLTEALRAGPGSPQWRQAVLEWRSTGVGESEHQLLMRVREHLASGKSYREIRAGPAFTRRVMDQIDDVEAKRAIKSPGAGWIASISGLVIVAVVAAITYFVWPLGSEQQHPSAATRLDRTYFVSTLESATFEDSISPRWQTFGNLTLIADNGLRPANTASRTTSSGEFQGGGAYWERALGADQAFAMECAVQVVESAKDAVVQLFVTDDLQFGGKSATTPHELVWILKDGEASVVLPDGSLAAPSIRLDTGRVKDKHQTVDVLIVLNRQQSMVEVNQQKLWSGANQLSNSNPRTIGIRFLVRGQSGSGGAASADEASVKSIRVLQPEPPKKQSDEAVVE